MSRDAWYGDDDGGSGRFVPLYVLVNGRTRTRNAGLDLATQVVALGANPQALEAEYQAVVRRCRTWTSVAEIAAHLRYPLTATKLFVDVLLEQGFLAVGSPAEETSTDLEVLEKILVRLQEL
ncbi:DUF742 domain-containing protein [Rugosimonospora acidiphila]|uniref:DUF742 domain-containing protein n=1 Tax=Rugosimonospora acidiphila TaxID=556531 RepID=A0ABP9SFI6_9ACTN